MTNSKLIIYLKTLSNAEMKDFGLFLSISKGAKDAFQLYNYLKKYHPNYSEKAIEKEKVTGKLFPKDKNKAKKLINAMQRCSRLLDEFLIQEELKTLAENQELLLLKALKKRRLDTYFFRKAEKLEKDWTNNPRPGLLTLHYLFRLKEMIFGHPKSKLADKKPGSYNLMLDNLDHYYFTVKLYWEIILGNNGSFLSNEEDKKGLLINEIQDVIHNNTNQFPVQVVFFNQLLGLIEKDDFSNFDKLKDIFFNNVALFTKREQINIAICLQTGLYENYRTKQICVINSMFDFNRKMVDFDLILEHGYIQTDKFWNIAAFGFAADQISWTKDFIERFGGYLPENEVEDVLSLTNAMLNFYEKKYMEALQYIAPIKFQNLMYSIRARIIQLQCYYELGKRYEELFWDFSKSFYMFLFRNNEISDVFKQEINQFLDLTKKLYQKKQNSKYININKIEDVLKEGNIISKSWLSKKLEELKN